jgi:hypothetical protein
MSKFFSRQLDRPCLTSGYPVIHSECLIVRGLVHKHSGTEELSSIPQITPGEQKANMVLLECKMSAATGRIGRVSSSQ